MNKEYNFLLENDFQQICTTKKKNFHMFDLLQKQELHIQFYYQELYSMVTAQGNITYCSIIRALYMLQQLVTVATYSYDNGTIDNVSFSYTTAHVTRLMLLL